MAARAFHQHRLILSTAIITSTTSTVVALTTVLRSPLLPGLEPRLCFRASQVHLATSLFECDAPLQPAMDHVFGGTLVCADKEAARAVCEKIGERTVTLEGDLYDPKGTLTGGSRPKSNNSILCRLGQLASLRQQVDTYVAQGLFPPLG